MGSKRGSATHLPPGFYAVPDPNRPAVLTRWLVHAGSLRDWPDGTRWRPVRPPYPEHLTNREERRDWSDAWYRDVYFAWKDAVVNAIDADPQAAATAFRAVEPDAVMPPPPPAAKPRQRTTSAWPQVKPVSALQRRLAEERMVAAALQMAGLSYAEIARTLEVPRTTAFRRASLGRQALAGNDLVTQVLMALRIGDLSDRLRDACLAGGPDDTERIRVQMARLQQLRHALTSGNGPDA